MSGHILLVDDEEAVLEFEREALAGAGAQVVAVSSAQLAIERLEQETFGAVLVDSDMPGECSAIDLYRWVAANRPGTEKSIVFTISDIRNSDVNVFCQQEHVPFIIKPFQVADLITAARSLLSRPEQAAAN